MMMVMYVIIYHDGEEIVQVSKTLFFDPSLMLVMT